MFGNAMLERRILEQTYDGVMDIWTTEFKTSETGEDKPEKSVLLSEIPCALSKLSASADAVTAQTNAAADISQIYIIFCSPDIAIPAGSWITVKQDNMIRAFKCSGKPFLYPTHQELTVLLEEQA